jgi:hypothetical protein
MNRRHVVAIAFLGIAACTTSGPESPAPGAKAETSVITSDPTATEGEAEGVVEQVGVSEAPVETTIADGNELICTREKLTGSRIPTKVCLTRAERERIQKEGQGYIEASKRKPAASSSQ